MRTLWGRPNSSNVMKVIWLLEELKIPYRRVDAGLHHGHVDTPEYRALNPNGVVPTLVEEDGFVLWESNVILRYLGATHPSPLWPDAPHARAVVDQWMDWSQTILSRPQSVVFQGLIRMAPDKRDHTAIGAATTELHRVWGMVDTQLARHRYVAGPSFTLADIPLGVHAHRWFAFPLDRAELPNLRRWYEDLLGRPAFKDHCAAPLT